MALSYFEYFNPVKILSGKNAVDNIPYELEVLRAKRPLIITDKGIVEAGLIDIVISCFKSSDVTIGAVYDSTPPDSSNLIVNEVAALYRENKCDSIIAVGGGSVLDTAKGVNMVITENTDDLMKYLGAERFKKPMQPFIAVPTTSGTGSEVTLVAVIANVEKKCKMAFTSYMLMPHVAVLDPRMTMTVPPKITAATGMDALTHAVEAYSCLQKNPLSDAYAWSAISLIRDNLMKAVKNGKDEEARMAMANASLMAGCAFSNSMVGIVHSIGHACGGVCHVPHGFAMAILLPHGMEYNLQANAGLYGELLLPLGGPEEYARTAADKRAVRTIAVIKELNNSLNKLAGLPVRLRDAGVNREQLPEIARTAQGDGSLIFNPVEADYNDILEILKSAY
ncbi:MAG TPA: iron-containing alcohol dehydrogenase [Syntrophomonadaceae bacterium]|nr:iron-containing alcohol dehydrogenase [Syntrophomonadaceae bacterium]